MFLQSCRDIYKSAIDHIEDVTEKDKILFNLCNILREYFHIGNKQITFMVDANTPDDGICMCIVTFDMPVDGTTGIVEMDTETNELYAVKEINDEHRETEGT